MLPSRVELQPGTGSGSAVTAAITVPSRSSALVCSWSSRRRSKAQEPASGASAGSTQVASESALTAIGSGTGRTSPSGTGSPSSRTVSAVSSATCRASRSTARPDSVGCTGRLRTSSTRPVAVSSALRRWLIALGVTCSARAAASSVPVVTVASRARS
jgi:hypothetical protein